MKLRVGGVYKARDGKRVRIVDYVHSNTWPYFGDNDLTYKSNGSTDLYEKISPNDIVAKWDDDKTQPANMIAEFDAFARRHGITVTVYHDTAHELKVEFRK